MFWINQLHFLLWWWKQYIFLKCWYLSTILYGIAFRKTSIRLYSKSQNVKFKFSDSSSTICHFTHYFCFGEHEGAFTYRQSAWQVLRHAVHMSNSISVKSLAVSCWLRLSDGTVDLRDLNLWRWYRCYTAVFLIHSQPNCGTNLRACLSETVR